MLNQGQTTRRIGVVGTGMMGTGIASACVNAGFSTFIYDVSLNALERAREQITEAIQRDYSRKQQGETALEVAARLHVAESIDNFADCDVVIEAVSENMDLKKELLSQLDKICGEKTILATNTSALSISEIAKATCRPDRVVGFHFHLPVTRTHSVEVIPGIETTEKTLRMLVELGSSLGKHVIVAQDSPGFIVNRLLVPYILDAIRFMETGIAHRDDIDASMRLGCNHPMGPLELADFIGLDILYSQASTMFAEFKEERFKPPPLLERMVSDGSTGVKSGRGFYNYVNPENKSDRRAQLRLKMAGFFQ